jgi:CBS domain-containing protein
MTDFIQQRTVGDVVLRPIAEVSATTSVRECARLLDERYDALIVLDPARVISARDIVQAVVRRMPPVARVDELDLEHVFCVPEVTSVDAALEPMLQAPSQRVIVQAADGRLCGRLTASALLRAIFTRPPWVEALQFALRIESTNEMEMEL